MFTEDETKSPMRRVVDRLDVNTKRVLQQLEAMCQLLDIRYERIDKRFDAIELNLARIDAAVIELLKVQVERAIRVANDGTKYGHGQYSPETSTKSTS